jgi:DNA-binding MarR family transcriptional regulator
MRFVADQPADSGYWYGVDDDSHRRHAVALLQSFRRYRAAEVAMRSRTRASMGMGENDMAVLRHLLHAEREGRVLTPSDLTRRLGISTASMTALIDRLEASGHARRERHPTDRRSIVVVPTPATDEDVRRTLGAMHERMIAAVAEMTDDEMRVVVDCLERLRHAVDQIDPVPKHDSR